MKESQRKRNGRKTVKTTDEFRERTNQREFIEINRRQGNASRDQTKTKLEKVKEETRQNGFRVRTSNLSHERKT